MRDILKYIFATLLIFSAVSCDSDFLNVTPEDRVKFDDVWKDPGLVEAFVNEMYRGLNHGMRELMAGSLVDESQFIHNYGSAQVVQSNLSSADLGPFTRGDFEEFNWNVLYTRIRQINIFMENIEKVPFDAANQSWKDRLKGEVHFLNAYFYHNLVRLYGGVPLVKRTFALEDEFLLPRNTFDESVAYIVSECDLAASLLPEDYNGSTDDIGRATKGAALALKSRILLYAASDLFNDPSWAGGYAKPELISSTSGSRTEKWQAAKDAAKAVIDLGIYNVQDTDNPVKDYTDVFLLKNSQEAIFSRYFIKSRGWEDGALPGLCNGPNGYHNWGGNTPIQELVDDYEMTDGTKFDWNNPAHAAAPYENRDPRLSASILYDQAPWRQRPSDVKDLDPDGKIIIRSVEKTAGVWTPGLDTRDGPIEDWNGGYSGYYLRKFVDPTVVHEYAAAGGNQEAPWHFFRLAEIYLNYAEACIELGEDNEAKTYLNILRDRAGMPDITETGQALLDRYRNERRIELVFEQHRYFDVRRWLIAPDVLNRNANGIVIEQPLVGAVTYERNKIQDRMWNDRMYFLPITQDELNRNALITQNPLY